MRTDQCVHVLFEQQASAAPRAPAIVADGRTITYGELNEWAEALARVLRERGVGPETIVGVYCEPSLHAIIAILATLKAGGAYAPLEPAHPVERVAYMISDAAMPLVLTTSRLRSRLPPTVPAIEIADDHRQSDATDGVHRPTPASHPDHVALVIYTSGSTGAPKGVSIPHRALVHRIAEGYPYSPGDIHKTSLAVIAHVSEVLLPLCVGAPVQIVASDAAKDPAQLAAAMLRHRTQRAVFVPSQLRTVLNAGPDVARQLSGLQEIIVGGEALPDDLVRLVKDRLPALRVCVGYGLTETAGMVSMGEVTPDTGAVSQPLPGSRVYVLDERLQPVAVGEVGDVYVAGGFLASGYLNRPALTAERFIPDPFAGDGSRMFRTGDCGRFTAQGGLHVLGRRDDQVKVSGLRVDLGEVARVLETQTSVREACVVPISASDGVRLVAFVTAKDPTMAVDVGAVRQHARRRLPWQMVPGAIGTVALMPLLANGKVDRQALMAIADAVPTTSADYSPPRTPTETALAVIWSEVLDVPSVGARDDFFDLGGTSLHASRLLSRVAERWNVELSVGELAEHPTPEALASAIDLECAQADASI